MKKLKLFHLPAYSYVTLYLSDLNWLKLDAYSNKSNTWLNTKFYFLKKCSRLLGMYLFLCPMNGNQSIYFWSGLCVSLSVAKTLTLVITFEPKAPETSYLVCVLNEWNPFEWYQGQWPCDLDRDFYIKTSEFGLCCRRGHSYFTNTSILTQIILSYSDKYL